MRQFEHRESQAGAIMNDAYKMPPLLRRRLGRRLRALRAAAGINLDEAAARLDKTRSSLHRIEAGETRADVHLIRSMMDLYDRYEEDLLEQAGRRSSRCGSAPTMSPKAATSTWRLMLLGYVSSVD